MRVENSHLLRSSEELFPPQKNKAATIKKTAADEMTREIDEMKSMDGDENVAIWQCLN